MVVLVALAGVATLHLAAALLEPRLATIPDLPANEGGRVALEGRALDVRHGDRGRFFILAADGMRAPVLAGPGEGPHRGDEVRVVGIVTRLDGAVGLSLERLDVTAPAGARILTPADVASRPEDHDGARVRVEGEARGGELRGDGARLRLAGVPPPGDGWWVASGDVHYDARVAAYVLQVGSWTRS